MASLVFWVPLRKLLYVVHLSISSNALCHELNKSSSRDTTTWHSKDTETEEVVGQLNQKEAEEGRGDSMKVSWKK